ncbi:alpha/beta hydrolase [Lignipirellula cremea]|uniref:Carboxylesterase NlhH n=1 Tax=Lignipirellula cremea TaxID=2528010 RepID=A0A518DVS2_9BACT|nr:alpha/beta hydrolase fold domain-containing protein [Lignipirellula cremea]QDU95936.1 Carboxylesterase NlhH [Lignipirellula cremea]
MLRCLLALSMTLSLAAGALAADNDDAITYRTEADISYLDPEKDATPYQQERCRLDVYYPENRTGFATVVWFHGGGLKGGNRSIPQQLQGKGVAVVAVNYRLYPKVKCPAYLQDAAASVAWTFRNIEKYGGDPKKIFVSGHSAGGYLTSMLGVDKRWLQECKIDADQIAGLIPLSGHTITHMTVREEQGIPQKQPTVDEFAPLYHVRDDAPPMLLITGDREMEMLGRYEENAYYQRMLKVAGHKDVQLYELQGYGHGMVDPAVAPMLRWMQGKGSHSGLAPRAETTAGK